LIPIEESLESLQPGCDSSFLAKKLLRLDFLSIKASVIKDNNFELNVIIFLNYFFRDAINLAAASLSEFAASPVNMTLCIPLRAWNVLKHPLLSENIVASLRDEYGLSAITIMLLVPIGIRFCLQYSSKIIKTYSISTKVDFCSQCTVG
jgi:hypothetical protein